VIVNNQWAISVPRRMQSAAETLAQKGIAAGIAAVQVDGNDAIAMLDVLERALARARAGEGPTLVEAVTYRLHDHTTADDARRYRTEDEVKAAWAREPLKRLRAYLTARGAWDDAKERAWLEECERNVNAEVDAYLASAPPPVTAMFDHLYAELPPDIAAQRDAAASAS
jgi:pyruvate dehydrogenase E1 component alpha subunit